MSQSLISFVVGYLIHSQSPIECLCPDCKEREVKGRYSTRGNRHKHFHCASGFHVLNFIGTYLSLLQFAPWIVDRPHCGCWGTQRGQWISFKLRCWKRHAATGVLPPTSTLILHGCAFSHWLNQWARDKRTTLLFFLPPPPLFFGASWKYKPLRESDLWHHLFGAVSYSDMIWGLWQRSSECVTLHVSDVIVGTGLGKW